MSAEQLARQSDLRSAAEMIRRAAEVLKRLSPALSMLAAGVARRIEVEAGR